MPNSAFVGHTGSGPPADIGSPKPHGTAHQTGRHRHTERGAERR